MAPHMRKEEIRVRNLETSISLALSSKINRSGELIAILGGTVLAFSDTYS
jgi:hypothetical protein